MNNYNNVRVILQKYNEITYNIDITDCITCEDDTQKKIPEDEFKPLHTEGSDIKNKLHEMKCEIGRRFYFSDMSKEDFHSKIYNPVVKSYSDANEVDLDNYDAQCLELATLINEKLKKHVYGK